MASPLLGVLKNIGKYFDPRLLLIGEYADKLFSAKGDFSQDFKRDKQFNVRDPFDKYYRFENGLNLITSELETGIPANTAIKRLPPKVVPDPITGKEVTWYPRQIGNATIYTQPNEGGNPYMNLPDEDLWGETEEYMVEETKRNLLANIRKGQVDNIRKVWAERPYWDPYGENMFAPVRDQALGENQKSTFFSNIINRIPKQ